MATTAVPETPTLDGEPNDFDRNQSKPSAADDPTRYRSHLVSPSGAPRSAPRGSGWLKPHREGADRDHRLAAGPCERFLRVVRVHRIHGLSGGARTVAHPSRRRPQRAKREIGRGVCAVRVGSAPRAVRGVPLAACAGQDFRPDTVSAGGERRSGRASCWRISANPGKPAVLSRTEAV
jgi:hypothetical protein